MLLINKSTKNRRYIVTNCHIPSLPVQKIYLYDNTAFPISTIQAYLPQQPSFLQPILIVVM